MWRLPGHCHQPQAAAERLERGMVCHLCPPVSCDRLLMSVVYPAPIGTSARPPMARCTVRHRKSQAPQRRLHQLKPRHNVCKERPSSKMREILGLLCERMVKRPNPLDLARRVKRPNWTGLKSQAPQDEAAPSRSTLRAVNLNSDSPDGEVSSPRRLCGVEGLDELRAKRCKIGHPRAGGNLRRCGVCPGADLYVVLGISTLARARGNQHAPKPS